MRRRDFIKVVSAGILAWPLAARGEQSAKTWRLGFIAHRHESFYDGLFEGLRELGYVEGQNLIIERRYAEGHAERFQDFAAEMVRLKADIVIVVTTPAALAVKNATTTIPIVRPNAIDPVESGLVTSLAHPGGNVTGLAVVNAELSAKRVEIFKQLLPRHDIALEGEAITPRPAIAISFRSFDTVCGEPVLCTVEVADTALQQGQGMHGSFSRADTWNFMAMQGPDFKSQFVDPAPASNADLGRTIAHLMQLEV